MTTENKTTVAVFNFGSFENYVAGDDFEVYEERMLQHFLLHDVPEERKVAFLLTHLGMDTYSILKKLLQPTNPSTKSYAELVAALKKHFKPDVNKISERYRFHQADQKAGQSVTEYVVELKALAEKCVFGDFLKDALRDRFVFGVFDSKLRTHLLKQKDLTFDRAVEESLNWELAEKDNKVRENVLGAHMVRHGKSNRSRSKSRSKFASGNQNGGPKNQTGRGKVCEKCGRDHERGKCPAKSWKCYACNKQGHTANMCYSKKQNRSGSQESRRNQTVGTVGASEDLAADIANLRLHLNSLENESLRRSKVETEVLFVEGRPVEFEIDSGACATVINDTLYRKCFSNLRRQARAGGDRESEGFPTAAWAHVDGRHLAWLEE